jgi:uncharacterized protein
MSTASRDGLSSLLFGRTRSGVLAMLYGRAEKSFYLREIARHIGISVGPVQRELDKLCRVGLITRASSGHQVFYQANRTWPACEEMRALIEKTVGAVDMIHSALAAISGRIRVAFIYGSVARREETTGSDVDLMVVGSARFDEVLARLSKAEAALGREINPTVYSPREFKAQLADGNNFLNTVVTEDKLFVIGNEDELAEVGGKRVAQAAKH